MQGPVVGTPEGGGHPLLPCQDTTQGRPAGPLPVRPQTLADELHGLIGQHGDKQVAFGARRRLVKHWAQPQLGFERAEHGLQVGQQGVGAP